MSAPRKDTGWEWAGPYLAPALSAGTEWDGADWTHESGASDPVYCEGQNPDGCETCRRAQADAAEAAGRGQRAVKAAARGDLHRAESEASEASDMESNYGDDPCWRALATAIRALQAADNNTRIEALREEALAAGDEAQAELCDEALGGDERARGECVRVIMREVPGSPAASTGTGL